MFVLSLFSVTATAGLSLVLCWAIVIRFATRKPDSHGDADIVLVLGSRLVKGNLTKDFTTRLERATEIDVAVPLLIAGGLSRDNSPAEAAAGRDWLVARGYGQRRILLEDRSHNTLENLSRSRDLMRRHGFSRPLLITSRYHLARSYILASGLGLSPVLCPTDSPGVIHPMSLARTFLEALMINWYYAGWFWARLTQNPSILAKLT